MSPRLDVPTFVAHWQRSTLTERSAAQRLLLNPTRTTASTRIMSFC